MTPAVATILMALAVAASGAWAPPQAPPVGRASLNLGVPTPAHTVGCEHEDAKAKANGWNLDFSLGVYRTCQPHVIAPRAVTSVKPQYTAAAMRAKIEGIVVLAAVIDRDGSVRDVRVLQSVDRTLGLDANAVDAVRRSTFAPGRLGANTVPVAVIIELQFTLR